MRIATWNINSVTARLDRLLAWLESASPDVVALQELKCTSDAFPHLPIQALGYEAVAHGNGRWNGVAILSRVGLTDVTLDLDDQPEFDGVVETRAVGATCGGVRIWSVYVPNGREPDHDHYSYKLKWFDALTATVTSELAVDPGQALAVIGDFNVAPTDADVWDIDQFTDSTHVTEPERAALADLRATGLADVPPRALKGEPYTFWDYRNGAFHRGWGMRIDLVYATAAFTDRVADAWIDRNERKGKGASDHAPLVVDLTDDPVRP